MLAHTVALFFSYLRDLHIVLLSDCNNLCYYQQCKMFSVMFFVMFFFPDLGLEFLICPVDTMMRHLYL